MQPADLHTALTELATAINRLRPDWRDAQDFYELRSQITGRLRSLADSPLATRTVIRPIRIEVPIEVRVEVPAPAPEPQPFGWPVVLADDELELLFRHDYTDQPGGWAAGFRRFQARTDGTTGDLRLTHYDLLWIWRQASRPWKGTYQRRARAIFWRSLQELFEAMGLKPSAATHLPTMTGRRAGPPKLAPRYLREADAMIPARDFRTDAALRPQPKRDGPDSWATPACLLRALVQEALPQLPPGRIWEPSAGACHPVQYAPHRYWLCKTRITR